MLRAFSHFKPKRHDVNCLLLNGGLGDHVGGSLITIDYILKNYPWINLLTWAPDFLVPIAKNMLGEKACVRPFSLMKQKYNREHTTISTQWDGRTSPMKVHLADYSFMKLCDELVPYEKKNSLRLNLSPIDISSFNLPAQYVVIVVGFTVQVREFNASAINAVSRYVRDKGYTPVFLGQKETKTGVKYSIHSIVNEQVDMSLGLDLLNKTDLLQAGKIIAGAKAIVGVDCGLMHVAGCTDTAIVGGYTTVRPEIRMPIRYNHLGWNCYPITPDQALECRFCQSDTNFLYGHDYKFCIYSDYECTKQLRAEKWIKQLEKVL